MSHINFDYSTAIVLICLFQMGSGYLLLGGDGDLDLPPLFDAGPESLLPGGVLCVLLTQGNIDLSLDFSLDLVLSTLIMDHDWDRDQVLLHKLTLLGVLEAEQALLEKYAGLCSKPIVHIDLISVGE